MTVSITAIDGEETTLEPLGNISANSAEVALAFGRADLSIEEKKFASVVLSASIVDVTVTLEKSCSSRRA